MSATFRLYRALTRVADPLAAALLRLLAREEPEALRDERLARVPMPPAATWWHAASLGEVGALRPLLERLPHLDSFVVTTTSRTGRERAEGLWPGRVSLAPIDTPPVVTRALAARRPERLILVETELWPNWLEAANRSGIPVAVVNGRLSEKAWPRTRRWRGLLAPVLRELRAVAVRTETDAIRFRELGVPEAALRVTGNTKHDQAAPGAPAALPWSGAPVWTVGSLRHGEEEAVFAAYQGLRERHPALKLVLAPRHPERWGDLSDRLAARGWTPARRSNPTGEDAGSDVLILDTRGELAAVYAASTVTFVGGTLLPVGGHNLLEAAVSGVPVAFGPHHENVDQEAGALLANHGAARVHDVRSLVDALDGWLKDGSRRTRAGEAARETAASLAGATARTLDWLMEREVLPRPDTDHV